MFPIRDDNPTIMVPYVTYGIVGLNVLAWVLLQGLGMEPQLSGSVCQFGLIPWLPFFILIVCGCW